jgi:iron complex transport system ATP-binding protein
LSDSGILPPLIEYKNVTISRGEINALNGLTMSIGIGEHIAILGPNGSGKSSLIKTVTRELYPRLAAGSYLKILGRTDWNVFELRPLLGIVSNDLLARCAKDFSGREIVLSGFFSAVGLSPHHEVTAAMEAKADDVLRLLEISHLAERRMSHLSSGEARRMLIARALVHDPKALVLDEPGSSLDLHATYELRKIFRKIAASGVGLIMVTHDLHDIIPEIERVILLKEGRVFADGPTDELLISETLSKLFGSPFEVVRRDGYYHLW